MSGGSGSDRVTRRDFAGSSRQGHRTRGAAAAAKKANQPTEVDWDAAIASLRRLLRRQYSRGAMAGPEIPHKRTDGEAGPL